MLVVGGFSTAFKPIKVLTEASADYLSVMFSLNLKV
jgi:hypothetical protein